MNIKNFIVFSILIATWSCKHKARVSSPYVYNPIYDIGEIPKLNGFQTYNTYEKTFDSIMAKEQSPLHDFFKYNRGRIFITNYENGKQKPVQKPFDLGDPVLCQCELHRDSLKISMATGFFGGFGFTINLNEDKFDLYYFEETDGDYFKSKLTDTSFKRLVTVKSKFQSLLLDERPTMKEGQQLTGFATYTSAKYYTKGIRNMLDTAQVSGKFYFTCKTTKVAIK